MAKKVNNTDKEDLERAVKLLKATVGFINERPNTRIRNDNQEYITSYELASAIDKFINKHLDGADK